MSAKLVAYEYLPSGFEIVIDNKDVEMGKIWNLWFNVKLTDNPEAWDSEIKLINKMQGRLGELTANQRLIRAHMAEFCREHPFFPQSIEILCMEIGTDHFSEPVRIGCEGRDLLNSLGYYDAESLNAQRVRILKAYVQSLDKWLKQNCPDNSTEFKVFGFLGRSTGSKKTFIEKLVSMINPEEPSISSLVKLSENECRKSHGKFETLGFRPFNCFKCRGCGSIPNCKCCYSKILDAGLLCVGTFGAKRSMFDEVRCFIEENILVYSLSINSWLKEEKPRQIKSLITARYMTKDDPSKIVERVHSYLGKKDESKEWLAACLLKTIKDNQRWHKRTELIDNFPEATSWFKEMSL